MRPDVIRYSSQIIGSPTLDHPDIVPHLERPGEVLEVEILQKMAALTSHIDALHNTLISRMDHLERRIAESVKPWPEPLTWQQRLLNWVKRLFGK